MSRNIGAKWPKSIWEPAKWPKKLNVFAQITAKPSFGGQMREAPGPDPPAFACAAEVAGRDALRRAEDTVKRREAVEAAGKGDLGEPAIAAPRATDGGFARCAARSRFARSSCSLLRTARADDEPKSPSRLATNAGDSCGLARWRAISRRASDRRPARTAYCATRLVGLTTPRSISVSCVSVCTSACGHAGSLSSSASVRSEKQDSSSGASERMPAETVSGRGRGGRRSAAEDRPPAP